MRRPLTWVREEIGAMGGLAALVGFALVSWAYWADVIQTRAQLYSFFGFVVFLAVLFGVFHYLMNRERATAMQQHLERGYAEWCRYHDTAFARVHRERMVVDRQRENMAELYARIKQKYPWVDYAADQALPHPPRDWYGKPASKIELPPHHNDDTACPSIDFGETSTIIDLDGESPEDSGITAEMVFEDSDIIDPEKEVDASPPSDGANSILPLEDENNKKETQ